MKRVFEIEYDDGNGEFWMNKDNLDIVIHTKQHCYTGACKIKDITSLFTEENRFILEL